MYQNFAMPHFILPIVLHLGGINTFLASGNIMPMWTVELKSLVFIRESWMLSLLSRITMFYSHMQSMGLEGLPKFMVFLWIFPFVWGLLQWKVIG